MLTSKRVQRFRREVFWVVLGQGAAVIGSVVGVRVLTAVLDPAAYGELALGMTIAVLVSQLLFGPLANGATRFFAPALEQDDVAGYLKVVKRLAVAATGWVGAAALITVVGLSLSGRPEWAALAFVSYLFGVLAGYDTVFNGIQNAARRRSVVALHQGLASWMRFMAAAGFVILLGASGASAILGYSAATVVILGSQRWWVRRVLPRRDPGRGTRGTWQAQLMKYSAPFGFWGLFTWAQFASARWSLSYFGTLQEVGLYSVLFQVGYYPVLLVTALAVQFAAPILFQRAGDATDPQRYAFVVRLSARLASLALGMTALGSTIVFFFHEQIFALVVDSAYQGMSYLLPWVLLAGGLFAAGQVLALNDMSRLQTRRLIAPKITTAIIGTALNVVGAFLYGVPGVVGGSVLFSASYLVWMLAISRNVSHVRAQR